MKEVVIETIKFIIPSLVVLATAYLVMRSFFDKEQAQSKVNIKLANAKIITPIRLQAYERLVLFLERITPELLIVRVFKPGMTIEHLHKFLLVSIRNEYEHNLSQQVYVSDEVWEAVRTAKESVLRLVNTVASSPRGKTNAQEFSKLVIEAYNSVDNNPTENAISILKKEIAQQIL